MHFQGNCYTLLLCYINLCAKLIQSYNNKDTCITANIALWSIQTFKKITFYKVAWNGETQHFIKEKATCHAKLPTWPAFNNFFVFNSGLSILGKLGVHFSQFILKKGMQFFWKNCVKTNSNKQKF